MELLCCSFCLFGLSSSITLVLVWQEDVDSDTCRGQPTWTKALRSPRKKTYSAKEMLGQERVNPVGRLCSYVHEL